MSFSYHNTELILEDFLRRKSHKLTYLKDNASPDQQLEASASRFLDSLSSVRGKEVECRFTPISCEVHTKG